MLPDLYKLNRVLVVADAAEDAVFNATSATLIIYTTIYIDKVPLAQAHMYAPSGPSGKFATDPYVQRQESSISTSTEVSLPMHLTRPGAVTPLDDSLLSVFEANQCYIGEDINSEIEHEAQRYKKGDTAVVAVPAQADDEEWPLDPNLTCPYCNVVFRRGQMREFRHHVDDCREA